MARELRLETWSISPACRSNKGVDGAWDEAIAHLRQVYHAQVGHQPDVTLTLAVGRVIEPD